MALMRQYHTFSVGLFYEKKRRTLPNQLHQVLAAPLTLLLAASVSYRSTAEQIDQSRTYSIHVLNPIQLEGSRCPLQLGSHVMLSKDFPLLWKYRPSSRISLPSSLSADTLLGIRPQLPTRRPSTCQVLEEVQGNCKQH